MLFSSEKDLYEIKNQSLSEDEAHQDYPEDCETDTSASDEAHNNHVRASGKMEGNGKMDGSGKTDSA
jgi:hypothetical protein